MTNSKTQAIVIRFPTWWMRLSEPNGQNSAREMHLGLSPSSIQTPSVGRAASLPRENLGPSAVRRHATALDPIASKNPNNSKQLVRRRRDSNRAVLLSNFYISNGLPTSVPTNWGSVARTASCLGDRRTPLATSDGEHPATQASAHDEEVSVKTLSIAADVGICGHRRSRRRTAPTDRVSSLLHFWERTFLCQRGVPIRETDLCDFPRKNFSLRRAIED
jgi:hypothetical protein